MTASLSLASASSPSWTSTHSNTWSMVAKVQALKLASYLTEPICKVREHFYSFYTLDSTSQNTAQKVAKSFFLTLKISACLLLAPLTAPFGMLLRGGVASVESLPYVYLERAGEGKALPSDRKITLVSHNECYMPGGYCITDGGVSAPADRIDANLKLLRSLNPDLICLYEVPDICDAEYLSSQLPEYPFLIPVAGIRSIGPSSMMYVASKYRIAKDSIRFIPFVKGTELTGRAKFSEKGVLSFDLMSRDKPLATIFSTHLQHSELPAKPEIEEVAARDKQLAKIVQLMQGKEAIIFTGDLNLDEMELESFLRRHRIDWFRRDPSIQGHPTWQGDQWCANLMGKKASGPLTLDYTLVAGNAESIATKIFSAGYTGTHFIPKALSDHDLLYSTVTFS